MGGDSEAKFKVLMNQFIKQIAINQNSVPPVASIIVSKKGSYRTENSFRS